MFVVALHPRSKEATGIQSNTITILTNDSSLTARVFTPYEQAQNHVQVGNYGLALRTMIEWIESLQVRGVVLADCKRDNSVS